MSEKFTTENENFVEFDQNQLNKLKILQGEMNNLYSEEAISYYKPSKPNQVEEFKKSQKPKKKLVTKILAWALGATIFIGAAVGAGFLIKDRTSGDTAYKQHVEYKYELVDKTLETRLSQATRYEVLENKKITQIEIMDPNETDFDIKVYYEGRLTGGYEEDVVGYAVFNALVEYYNKLVTAEESGNALYYLDALNEIFSTMRCVETSLFEQPIYMELPEVTEENIGVFNEIFNLNDINNPDIIRQVGFLPYRISVSSYEFDEANHTFYYTYEIRGISYCETKSESNSYVSESDKLIMSNNYNKNNIKAYNRVMTFSSYTQKSDIFNKFGRLSGDIYKIIDEVNNPYEVKTTYFKEVDLMEAYNRMKDGEFNFKKPEDFNLREYIKTQEKEINKLQ